MKIKDWFGLIKDNIKYLIVFLIGVVMLAIGGIIWNCCVGKILLCGGIIVSLIAAILGLRNKDLEWEEFD